jgi:hypothetical protein
MRIAELLQAGLKGVPSRELAQHHVVVVYEANNLRTNDLVGFLVLEDA